MGVRDHPGRVDELLDSDFDTKMPSTMTIHRSILFVLLEICCGLAIPETPTPFPNAFHIAFHTNITESDDTHPISGHLYYDWDQVSQRIDHSPGSYECVTFYQTNQSCSLLFINHTLYRILADDDCCLDLEGVGPPPPDWATRAQPTFSGMVLDDYTNRYTYEWVFDHHHHCNHTVRSTPYKYGLDVHSMRQVVDWGPLAGQPVLFTFPNNHSTQDIHYLTNTIQLGPVSPSVFQLPSGCQTVPCHDRRHERLADK